MAKPDLSYEAALQQEYRKLSGTKPKPIKQESMSIWIELIHDLIAGAGYSYSRIAYRIHCSPSTIQKLATNPRRQPRLRILHPLVALHEKVFQGQYVTPRAQEYWEEKRR